MLRRTLARLDVTSRTLFALIEPGSCFAGTLLELALAADRSYMLAAERRRRAADDRAVRARTSAPIRWSTAARASQRGSTATTRRRSHACRDAVGRALSAADALELGLVTVAPDDLDWDDEVRIALEERASLSPDALTGMEANLRFAGRRDDGDARSSAGCRRGRTGSSSGPNAVGEARRAQGVRHRAQGTIQLGPRVTPAHGDTDEHRLRREDSQQRRPRGQPHAAARARALAARVPARGGARWARRARSDYDVYLRTAVSVDAEGLGALRLREDARLPLGHLPRRRPSPTARSNFGEHKGEPAWQEVPGEYRANLRRLIVTQGDTEPASVEQQRHLGLTCPSLYDLRNLFQVNVEEGRHLWAMVYLLHALLRPRRPRGGRGAARAPLGRRRQPAHPRRVQRADAGLARRSSCSRIFTDRDGKYQLCCARRVGLRPARAHLPLHADRGGAPHVRRRDGRGPRHPAHRGGDGARAHRRPGAASARSA